MQVSSTHQRFHLCLRDSDPSWCHQIPAAASVLPVPFFQTQGHLRVLLQIRQPFTCMLCHFDLLSKPCSFRGTFLLGLLCLLKSAVEVVVRRRLEVSIDFHSGTTTVFQLLNASTPLIRLEPADLQPGLPKTVVSDQIGIHHLELYEGMLLCDLKGEDVSLPPVGIQVVINRRGPLLQRTHFDNDIRIGQIAKDPCVLVHQVACIVYPQMQHTVLLGRQLAVRCRLEKHVKPKFAFQPADQLLVESDPHARLNGTKIKLAFP
mmetsp:Transcript_51221/g.92064  ORF Transcript_51221/g.92064 Transcript_51221/m.92064 type:complete len:262 (+) Transcript_51221:515-1300(+)